MASSEPPLNVKISPDADEDLWGIWVDNLVRYKIVEHADEYDAFLRAGIKGLAFAHGSGSVLPEFPELRYMVLRKSSRGHGHYIFYKVDPVQDEVKVLRVYHSRMDIVGRLKAQFD